MISATLTGIDRGIENGTMNEDGTFTRKDSDPDGPNFGDQSILMPNEESIRRSVQYEANQRGKKARWQAEDVAEGNNSVVPDILFP